MTMTIFHILFGDIQLKICRSCAKNMKPLTQCDCISSKHSTLTFYIFCLDLALLESELMCESLGFSIYFCIMHMLNLLIKPTFYLNSVWCVWCVCVTHYYAIKTKQLNKNPFSLFCFSLLYYVYIVCIFTNILFPLIFSVCIVHKFEIVSAKITRFDSLKKH